MSPLDVLGKSSPVLHVLCRFGPCFHVFHIHLFGYSDRVTFTHSEHVYPSLDPLIRHALIHSPCVSFQKIFKVEARSHTEEVITRLHRFTENTSADDLSTNNDVF